MGNAEKLLESLAKKLPRISNREVLQSAVRAAADSLPENLAGARSRLWKFEDEYVEKLLQKLQEAEEAEKEGQLAGKETEDPFVVDGDEKAAALGTELYVGFDSSKPLTVLQHCSKLLSTALSSLRPEKVATDALEGLMGFISPEASAEDAPFGIEIAEACAQLVAPAAALLTTRDSNLWRRFLGLVLSAPLRIAEPCDSARAVELTARSAALVSMVAVPESARSALRLAVACVGSSPSRGVLQRVAQALLPMVRAGFSVRALDKFGALTRGDLVGLLQALRLVGLCNKQEVCSQLVISEVRGLLQSALQRSMDASTLLQELNRMAKHVPGLSKAQKKRLETLRPERVDTAAAVADLITSKAASIDPKTLSSFAANCGLPIGGDEDFDVRAAAAHARGDLFFEDNAGTGALEQEEEAEEAPGRAKRKEEDAEEAQGKKKMRKRSRKDGGS